MSASISFRTALVGALALAAAAGHAAQVINHLPAPTSFTLGAAGLPDGRFAIYNGDTVFFQSAAGADSFTPVATGYEGDPAFIIASPSGARLLLGAGGFGQEYTNNLYEVDAVTPADYTPAAIVAQQPHFGAVFLTEALVLIDSGDFLDSQLDIIDLDAKAAGPRTVVKKPVAKAAVVDPKPGYSASLAYDTVSGRVYAMDANTRELRYFSQAALVDAFVHGTQLDWVADGTLVGAPGDFAGGGAAGVTTQGYVVLGGTLGFSGPGLVQVVHPLTGHVLNTLDPAGDEGYTTVFVNAFTGDALVQQSGQNFLVSEQELISPPATPQHVPVAGPLGLLALAGMLGFASRRAMKR
jgi:hypothetical protein